ncbi:MAG: hypothetical protein ACK479_09280 [Fluviicola sp.]
MSAFDRLIEQIDSFIRKFYKNEMLKGAFLVLGVLLASWLLVSILEYFGRFDSWIRFMLFWTFIGLNSFLLFKYFIVPLLRLTSFGKRINRYQASKIIGDFFPTISDRLLNTLQLNDTVNENDASLELIRASVVQKANSFSTINFVDAVRTDESKRYLKFLIPIALVFVSILLIYPTLISKGTANVVNYNQAQEAPFDFELASNLSAIREGDSLPISVNIFGEYVPEKVFLVCDRGRFLMTKTTQNQVAFSLSNVRTDVHFHFESEGFSSKDFSVKVLGKAGLAQLTAKLSYPKYLHRKNEVVSNIADLDVPEGTKIDWEVQTRFAKSTHVLWNGAKQVFSKDKFTFSKSYSNSGTHAFVLKSLYSSVIDSSFVQVEVLKDEYPSIFVSESIDSISTGIRFFSGMCSDDYGLTRLNFVYSISKKNGQKVNRVLNVDPVSGTNHKFNFSVDFSREDLDIEDKINYHFVIMDNDGVNGSKATQSQAFVYQLPTLEKLNEKREETQEELKNALSNTLSKVEEFKKDVDKLQKSIMNQSKSDFKSLEQVQQLQQQQQQITQELQDIKEKMEQSNEEKNQLSEQEKELLEQQELIDKLLEELMDDEMKKLLEEMEKLMKNNNQQELKQDAKELKQSSEDMKEQMDRTLESLKKLQVNEQIDDIEKELESLSKEQEELKKDLESGEKTPEQGAKEQEELNKKFDELIKDMQETLKLNSELKRPLNLSDFEKEQQEISNEMQEAKDKLDDNKKSKAGQNQKSASDKMKEMAEKLNKEQEASNQKQDSEDMALLRLLLENLMALSFEQEYVMNRFEKVSDTDPYYRKLGRKQRRIIDDTKIVEDSLLALAKRQTKIAPFIDQELKEIRTNFALAIDEVDEHKRKPLLQHQQLVMTSYNNLALMLNESLQQMQQQQQEQQKKEGSGSCDNPGGSGKPKSGQGDKMGSQDMKEMLKQQLEQMKKGPMPGGKQPGEKPGEGQGQNGMGMPGLGNEQIAKMAAQQTAIRQKLEQIRDEMNKEGQGKGNQLNPLIQELEKQERDLINKNFSPEMIRRQQDILTRLLESDKAIRERGFEEKRESQSGKNQNYGNLIRFDEYTKKKLGQVELIRSVDPLLSRYYKNKANEYFNKAN